MPFSTNVKRLVKYYLLGKSEVTSSNLGWGQCYNSTYAQNLDETGKVAALRHSIDISSDECRDLIANNVLIIESLINWCEKRRKYSYCY